MEVSAEALETYANGLWPHLLLACGRDPSCYRANVLKTRLVPGSSRILLLLKGPPGQDLVFKTDFPANNLGVFRNQINAQRRAFELMASEPGHNVPEIFAVDEERRGVVMEYATGPAVFDALKHELDRRTAVLEKAGAWIGSFHRNSYVRHNPVNPDAMLQSLAQITRQVENRGLEVAGRSEFLKYATQVPALAEAVRGQETRIAAVHGDLHLRNVILARDAVYGIDFTRVHHAPTAHDLSLFLVRFAMNFCTNYRDKGPGLFNPGDMDAFYRGYGQEYRDDPALRYLLPLQILMEWRLIPKDKNLRKEKHMRQFRGLQRMARIVFEN